MADQTSTRLRHPEFRGRIGVARAEVTPPIGIYSRTWGSARHDQAEGVHRPLLATCLTFQDIHGGDELILITLDVMIFWQDEADRIRAAILQERRLKPHQLILHPSHSHGTPFYLRRQMDRPGGDLIAPYLSSIPTRCCSLIDEALAFNRDAVDPASGRDICGLNLAVEADHTVLVGRIAAPDGTVQATIVNYACHPVSLGGGNRLLSPDYIGAMREVVEQQTGGAVCVFFQGAAGDVTPRRSYESDVEAADQNGRELGYAALSTLTAMFPPGQQLVYQGIEESGTPLGIWRLRPKDSISTQLSAERITSRLPIREMPERDELEQRLAQSRDRVEIERLERAHDRRKLVGDGKEGDLSCTVWRLGESFLVATPAEPYTQFQIALRQQFPDAAVAVLMASDGAKNYLPLPEAFQRDVYQVRVSLYEAGALEQVTAQVAQVIEAARVTA